MLKFRKLITLNNDDMILKSKSYEFAVNIIKLCHFLVKKKKDFQISNQLLRSGTAIGALIREAEYAQSPKDFVHKLSIALKEANESSYWLDLLKDTEYITSEQHKNLYGLNIELIKMLIASIKTTKSKF